MNEVPATSETIKQYLKELKTVKYLCARFGRSEMTIHHWMKKGLPHIYVPGDARPAIRFDWNEVKAWAKANGKKLKS